jgi:hypothetical protein
MTGMQPQNQEQNGGLEQLPVNPLPGGERVPVLPSPEAGITTGVERREQAAELQAAAADAAQSSAPQQVAVPVAPVVPQLDPVAPVATTAGPLIAEDADLIEKEWVDRAKKIILETRDDPFTRTTRVNELQKDYLKKRYNKELGA